MKNKVLLVILGFAGAFMIIVASHSSAAPENAEKNTPIPVEVQTIDAKNITQTIQQTGYVQAEQQTHLASKIIGRVKSIGVSEGMTVRKGQTLVFLESDELLAQQRLSEDSVNSQEKLREQTEKYYDQTVEEAKAALDKAQEAYEVAKESDNGDQRSLAKEDVEKAEEALETARQLRNLQKEISQSQYSLSQEKLNVARVQYSNANIRAPFSGVVIGVHANEGDVVSPGQPILSLAASHKKEVELSISLDIAKMISTKDSLLAKDKEGNELLSQVIALSPMVGINNRKALAVLELPQDNDMFLGESIFVELPINEKEAALVVPNSAIIVEYHDAFVYVINDNNKAEKKAINVGLSSKGESEVISGLKKGQRVVVEGQHALQSGSVVKVIKEDGV